MKITGCENKSVDINAKMKGSTVHGQRIHAHRLNNSTHIMKAVLASSTEIKPNGIVSHAGGDMTTEFSTVAKYGIFDHFTVIFFHTAFFHISALG